MPSTVCLVVPSSGLTMQRRCSFPLQLKYPTFVSVAIGQAASRHTTATSTHWLGTNPRRTQAPQPGPLPMGLLLSAPLLPPSPSPLPAPFPISLSLTQPPFPKPLPFLCPWVYVRICVNNKHIYTYTSSAILLVSVLHLFIMVLHSNL